MTSPIKVETFDVDITTNGSTHTLTNDVGDISKAFIRINNSTEKSTGGPTGSTGNAAPNLMYCGAELTDTNEITWHKNTSTSVKHVGEVWRFTGSASSFNSFVVRGRFAISASGTSTSQAVSDIVDEDKCVPFITGINSSEGNGSGFDSSFFAAHMDGSGNVVLTSNHSSAAGTVYVTVVEFTGSNWNVGHGVSSSHDSSTETVTLNTDSTGAGGSTFDVGDWTTAWIEGSMGGDTAETGLADCQALIYPHADTDKVYFSVIIGDGAARNDASGYIHVIQNDEIDVNRVSNLNIAEGNGSYGTAAWPASSSTTADIEDLALEWFTTSSGTGTAHGRGRLATRITDATGTITHWVHRSGNTVKVKYGVIDFTNLTSIEHVKKSLDGYCIIDSSNFFKQLDTDSHIKVVDIQKTIEMDSYIIYKFQKDLTSNSFIRNHIEIVLKIFSLQATFFGVWKIGLIVGIVLRSHLIIMLL